ncbi:MAG: hypothetical protein WCY43_03495 [Patescibacteria group bacterium]|nr:hypothetical protein [Patescibacteria group bacterium]
MDIKKIKKILNIIRMFAFVGTLLTTIPLFINYLLNLAPKNELIVHLHVWLGILFFVFAVISMILQKKENK